MTHDEIEKRIIKIIKETIGEREITADSKIIEDLGADSMDSMAIIVEIECAFDMTIDNNDIDLLKTVGELTEYVAARIF